MELEKLSVEELKKGYRFDQEAGSYICNTCGQNYETGEIYKFGDRLFEASKAMEMHIETDHEGSLKNVLFGETKYNTLTDNQRDLVWKMYMGMSDKEISQELGISPSTVRNQRFTLREKAKQAKLYLAIYEQAIERKSHSEDRIIPVHSSATMVDDRYVITEKERDKILNAEFESLEPLRLKRFPGKEKKKIVILRRIAEEFDHGRKYDELQMNEIIKEIFDDYAVIRRYLIEYGFMDRTRDGKEYWLK
jgi:DNA-binding CsgD family transcriptional regulator